MKFMGYLKPPRNEIYSQLIIVVELIFFLTLMNCIKAVSDLNTVYMDAAWMALVFLIAKY